MALKALTAPQHYGVGVILVRKTKTNGMEDIPRSNLIIFYIRLCWSIRCCSVCSRFKVALRNGSWRDNTQMCEEIRKHSTHLYYREARLSRWHQVEIFGSLDNCEALACKNNRGISCIKVGYTNYLNNILLQYNRELSPLDCNFSEKENDGNILSLAQRTALRDKEGFVFKKCTVCMSNHYNFRIPRPQRCMPVCFACGNSIRLFSSPE